MIISIVLPFAWHSYTVSRFSTDTAGMHRTLALLKTNPAGNEKCVTALAVPAPQLEAIGVILGGAAILPIPHRQPKGDPPELRRFPQADGALRRSEPHHC